MQYEPKRKLTPQSKETGWTVEEYYQLPEEENVRYELVNGRLELLSAPSTTHQRISHSLANLFGREDKVFSERIPCIGFVVEEVLTLR
jgi:Uma2 family endonuclease